MDLSYELLWHDDGKGYVIKGEFTAAGETSSYPGSEFVVDPSMDDGGEVSIGRGGSG